MNLLQKLREEADASIGEQLSDGSMPAGHNGPYHHRESNLRNSSHWLITWSLLYTKTGARRYREAALASLEYVLDSKHRPHGANWKYRYQPGRDSCNGVIGAAWTGEALWAAANALQREDAYEAAVSVFRGHQFDAKSGLWHRWEVDGTLLPIDQTFNHQLWYAATAARLGNCGESRLGAECGRFMDKLGSHFATESPGWIRHRIPLYYKDRLFRSGTLLHLGFHAWKSLKARRNLMDSRKRDIGYHAFNLLAFSVLYHYFPNHCFWKEKSWRRALNYVHSAGFRNSLYKENKYAFPYNPVGFEVATALRVFVEASDAESMHWVERQWQVMTDSDRRRYGESSEDPATARARLYEGLSVLWGEGDLF